MGCKAICGAKSDSHNNSEENHLDQQQGLQVIIHYPKGKKKPFKLVYQDGEKEESPIIDVMNALTFGKGKEYKAKFDGNFISIYNAADDRYHYFCHRLIDIEIENPTNPYQGKIWVPYINKHKYDWDDLIENNYKISLVNTKIEWKLEQFKENKNIDFKNHSKQHSTVISVADINLEIQNSNNNSNGQEANENNNKKSSSKPVI